MSDVLTRISQFLQAEGDANDFDSDSRSHQFALHLLSQIRPGDELPGGLVVVPKEPSGDMVHLGVLYRLTASISNDNPWPADTRRLWSIMIAAAKETSP